MLSEAKHLAAHRERPFPFATLRAAAHCAQGDNTVPILIVKTHHRAGGGAKPALIFASNTEIYNLDGYTPVIYNSKGRESKR